MRRFVVALLLPFIASAQGVTAPRILSTADPPYSDEARRAGVNATVKMSLAVNISGIPEDVTIERGAGFGLDELAVETVKKWRFAPGTKDGNPVLVRVSAEVNFRLLLKEHEDQSVRLEMNNAGGSRPQMIQGGIPANPDGPPADSKLRIAFTIDTKGVPRDLSVIESTPGGWARQALPEISKWRFSNPSASEVAATLEIVRTPSRSAGPVVLISPTGPTDSSLPPPRLISPADGAAFDAYPRRTTFRWEPVAGAAKYLLEWDYSYNGVWHAEDKGTPGAAFPVEGVEFSFDFVGAQPGRWRVWPVNARGERGTMPSEWRTFRYER